MAGSSDTAGPWALSVFEMCLRFSGLRSEGLATSLGFAGTNQQ